MNNYTEWYLTVDQNMWKKISEKIKLEDTQENPFKMHAKKKILNNNNNNKETA